MLGSVLTCISQYLLGKQIQYKIYKYLRIYKAGLQSGYPRSQIRKNAQGSVEGLALTAVFYTSLIRRSIGLQWKAEESMLEG